jgi:hypothetical protein
MVIWISIFQVFTVNPLFKVFLGKKHFYVELRKALNGGGMKMKQKMTPLVIKTLAKCRICMI